MPATDLVGYAATVAACGTMVPQIAKVIKTGSSEDISYWMIFLSIMSSSLWGVYGLLTDKIPLVVSGVISASASGTLLCLKIRGSNIPRNPYHSLS